MDSIGGFGARVAMNAITKKVADHEAKPQRETGTAPPPRPHDQVCFAPGRIAF